MRSALALSLTLAFSGACLACSPGRAQEPAESSATPGSANARRAPVNRRASREARELLAYLYRISGKNTLSGQHNFPGTLSRWTERAKEITGKYPAVWGQDFGFTADGQDGIVHRQAIIDEAKRQHAQGGIVTLMWHAVCPTDDEPNGWQESVLADLTPDQWRELVTPGTRLHKRWLAQIDVVAGYLKQLRDARVPVLWRPYHEMNGGWFWWGGWKGDRGFRALWRLMFDRYTRHHRLDNLLWVWNANAPNPGADPYPDYYPGADVVDVLAIDVYRNDYQRSHYDELLKLAQGKPVALGEVGDLPTPALLDAQPRWAWFMTWTSFLEQANTQEEVRALYGSPRVLTRDEVRLR